MENGADSAVKLVTLHRTVMHAKILGAQLVPLKIIIKRAIMGRNSMVNAIIATKRGIKGKTATNIKMTRGQIIGMRWQKWY